MIQYNNAQYSHRNKVNIPLTAVPEQEEQKNDDSSVFNAIKSILYSVVKEAMAEALQEHFSKEVYRYPENVTIDQACEITGYTKNSLYQMHSRGAIPGAFKLGGKLLFNTAVLRKWVDNGGKILL